MEINELEKPVQLPCALAAIPGDFSITATNFQVSAQPSYSNRSPRIFLSIGDKLIISVVPEGEMSQNIAN